MTAGERIAVYILVAVVGIALAVADLGRSPHDDIPITHRPRGWFLTSSSVADVPPNAERRENPQGVGVQSDGPTANRRELGRLRQVSAPGMHDGPTSRGRRPA